ncbi:uncharacterized protein MYCFIDRAFT_42475 [Pseudocercospora fijiensis CIRAD86]|uniref:AMP-dependent synthetase/ligase domain-containing protein n=1 Tax=Pseudocercospora fijiensis (strain CIRAD86) TaxID=383855 RepID=M3AJD5_PSEFD|nr:uncharacterized protein MYCFIDRAFT_42475 [Pseudocercospora fijiensis CIRAD86]EME77268.1 hypothetical protein MYCFIDRAFT_42475 [Pseudocercospora fijiensis CIRAD86]
MVVHTSPLPDLDIPRVNLLSYLYPSDEQPSDEPVWIDAAEPKKALSPRQMLTWVKRIMIGLDRLGLKRGDVCLIHTPNNVFVPAAYLGIVGGARCFSAINPIYTVEEIVYQMKLTGAKCILAHPSVVERDLEAAKKAGTNPKIFQFSDDEAPLKEIKAAKDWRHMLGSEQEAQSYHWPELSPDESVNTIATINFSSGTTGLPKGVMIGHHALIANVEQTAAVRWPHLDMKKGEKVKGERWLGFLPLYHAYGQLYACVMAVKFHVPIRIMRQFVYEDFCSAIQRYKISHLQVAPPILVMMAKRPETKNYDLSSIQGILCGGAPLGKELQNDIARRFNCEVKQGWGMTEVTCGSILQFESRDDGTVGKLIPNNKLKLVDDNDQEVGFDTPGEMLIKAPNVMLGYWRNEKATSEALSPEGWLRTGDIAVINREGYIWIVDRKKELIKVNALQVAPAELEDKLLENPDLADAAVVGIAINDEEWPRAYVVLSEDGKKKGVKEKDVQNWFKPRVAKHKALVGGVQFVDEIPKLPSGKIVRKLMKEWAKRDAPEVEKSFNRSKL